MRNVYVKMKDVLESDGEARVDIDACLGIIPTTTRGIQETASFRSTIARILGVEDIIDLTHEADIGPLAIGYWQ